MKTKRSTVQKLKRFHAFHFLLWLVPGGVASWILRDSVPWVNFLSWYAICITSLTTWQASRAESAIEDERHELEGYFHHEEEKRGDTDDKE